VSAQVFVVRQSPAGAAALQVLDADTGGVLVTGNLSWDFPAPLVETTWDAEDSQILVVSFPDNVPTVWKLDATLTLLDTWTPSFELFDLQFSPGQSALYGIQVSSKYGRVLTQFTYGSNSSNALFTLPYMWYVNASTFDRSTNTYYGLLNNFPGFPNSTVSQKLVVGEFSNPQAPVASTIDLDNSTGLTLHFVSWWAGSLYGLALSQTGPLTATFVQFNGQAGYAYKALASLGDLASVGPLFVQEGPMAPGPSACTFAATLASPQAPTLFCLPLLPGSAVQPMFTYEDGVGAFSATAYMYTL